MSPPPITIRQAMLSERTALEALQRRSSMHEPMYRAQLAAHPDAIEVPAEHIESGAVRVAEQDGAVVGFAALLAPAAGGCELDALFVEPERMRSGIGRSLIEDAEEIARERGATRIDVVANPQAVAFYHSVGFTQAGHAETRFGPAPRMSLRVGEPAAAIRVLDRTDPSVAAELARRIDAFNVAAAGVHDAREVVATMRDESGTLVAGVDGWTWGGTCWIEHLWVRETDRRHGLGSRLLDTVEREARRRGCAQIALDTHSFHGPAFYRRHGFETVAELPGYPAGHSYVLMRKLLS